MTWSNVAITWRDFCQTNDILKKMWGEKLNEKLL